MSDALHYTQAGETLESIAATYYQLSYSNGKVRQGSLRRVVTAIRAATPATPGFDLGLDPAGNDPASFGSQENLGGGRIVHVPTLRDLARPVAAQSSAVATAFRQAGFLNARTVLERPRQEVADYVQATATNGGWTPADLLAAVGRNELFVLDGMDVGSLDRLWNANPSIRGWSDLALQSTATLNSILGGAPHGVALQQQDHARRWRTESRIQTRAPRSSVASLPSDSLLFSVPIPPRTFLEIRDHLRSSLCGACLAPDEREAAESMSFVADFAAQLLNGHLAVLSDRPKEALGRYTKARALVHRYAEANGVAPAVADSDGMSPSDVARTAFFATQALPDGDPSFLGAPCLRLSNARHKGRWGLTGFRISELAVQHVAIEYPGSLLKSLNAVPVHRLPMAAREAIVCAISDRTLAQLEGVSSALLLGSPRILNARVRDLSPTDQLNVRRNVLAFDLKTLLSSSLGLLQDEQVDALVTVAAIATASGSLPTKTAGTVLKNPSAYPATILGGSWRQRFVRVPVGFDQPETVFARLGADGTSFANTFRQDVLIPRLTGASPNRRHVPEDFWISVSAIAATLPYLYTRVIGQGISRAHAKLGAGHDGIGSLLGTQVVDLSATSAATDVTYNAQPEDLNTDFHLGAHQSTGVAATPPDLIDVENAFAEAERLYSRNQTSLAAQTYRQVIEDARLGLEALTTSGEFTELESAIDPLPVPPGQNVPATPGSLFGLTVDDVPLVELLGLEVFGAEGEVALTDWIQLSGQTAADLPPSGSPFRGLGDTAPFTVDEYDIYITQPNEATPWFFLIWKADGRLEMIEAGLLRNGLRPDVVPIWDSGFLLNSARQLTSIALQAEERVLTLLSRYEASVLEQEDATNQEELARLKERIAKARRNEAKHLRTAADEAVRGAENDISLFELQYEQSQVLSFIDVVGNILTTVAAGSSSPGLAVQSAASAVSGGTSAVFAALRLDMERTALSAARDRAVSMQSAAAAGYRAMKREHEAAAVEAAYAVERNRWLTEERRTNAQALAQLLNLSAEIATSQLENASRLAWLTQRALAVESRRAIDVVDSGYVATADPLGELSRAQRLQNDLEALFVGHVVAEQDRRQRIQITLPLSRWFPEALLQLRETGECVFHVSDELIDRFFAGHLLHSVQNIEVRFIGALAASRVQALLRVGGVSFTRVPNEPEFTRDTIPENDWTVDAFAGTGHPEEQEDANRWVLKSTTSAPVEMTLSEFDLRRDQILLQLPDGQLGPVQHLGVVGQYFLRLPPGANTFSFEAIADVELTLSLLSIYDRELEARMIEARRELASAGRDLRTTESSWDQAALADALPIRERDEGQAMVLPVAVDDTSFGNDEVVGEQQLTNVLVRVPPNQGTGLSIRLSSALDPGGELVTLDDDVAYTASYSWLQDPVTLPATLPNPSTTLETWVDAQFRSSGQSPKGAWSLKVVPGKQSDAWLRKDETGAVATATHGPLAAPGNGGQATWTGNIQLRDTLVRVPVTFVGTNRFELRLREQTNGHHYAFRVTNPRRVNGQPQAQMALLRVEGSETTLASMTLITALAEDEPWVLTFHVAQDGTTNPVSTRLVASIDGMKVLEAHDTSGALSPGALTIDVDGPAELDSITVLQQPWEAANGALLLDERTATVPSDWQFTGSWMVQVGTSRKTLDMRALDRLALTIEYRYEHV